MQLPEWLKLKPEVSPELPTTCQHIWGERTRSYSAPVRLQDYLPQLSEERLLRIITGFTTIIDQCQLCSDIRETIFAGSPDPQLDELMNKSLLYGPQFIQRDGSVFCIQLYQPQSTQQGSMIPIR